MNYLEDLVLYQVLFFDVDLGFIFKVIEIFSLLLNFINDYNENNLNKKLVREN